MHTLGVGGASCGVVFELHVGLSRKVLAGWLGMEKAFTFRMTDGYLGPFLLKMVGSKPEGCTLEWVNEITDREQGCWDEHLVRSAMMPCDSELILQLPVGQA